MKSAALQRAAAGAVPVVPSVSAVVAPPPGVNNVSAEKREQLAYSMTDIARILGIHPRTISRDIERYPDFPAPLRVGLGKRLYVLTEVIEFYRRCEVGK